MVEAARPSSRAIPRRLRPSTLSAASRSLSSSLRCVPPDIAPSRIAVLGQSGTTTPQDVALHAGVRPPVWLERYGLHDHPKFREMVQLSNRYPSMRTKR